MYSRSLEGDELTFGVSGKLWHGVLVMFDRESGSLWTQLDGRAIQGPESGRSLEHVPSVFTTWAAWLAAHPDTLVLEKDEAARGQQASHYAEYFADAGRTFLPHLGDGLGEGVGPKRLVFGVRTGGGALAVTEERLTADGLVQARLGDVPVAWLRDPGTGEVLAVRRELDGEEVNLGPLEGVSPTERVRVLGSGQELGVEVFEALRVDRAFWYAWARTVEGAQLLGE